VPEGRKNGLQTQNEERKSRPNRPKRQKSDSKEKQDGNQGFFRKLYSRPGGRRSIPAMAFHSGNGVSFRQWRSIHAI